MDLLEAIMQRRSVRKFLPDPVDEVEISEIIQAGTLAINAENKQMWYFVAVTNRDLIQQLGDYVTMRINGIVNAGNTIGKCNELDQHRYFLTFFREAPAVIAVFTRPFVGVVEKALDSLNMEFKTPEPILPGHLSIGAAIQNIVLTAHAMGYGTTCMTGPVLAFQEIQDALAVSEPWLLTAILPIGRPAHQPKARARKPLDEVLKIIR